MSRTAPCVTAAVVLLICSLFTCTLRAQNVIEHVEVETYYVSDGTDATDTTGGTLVAGTRTYRVFIGLADSCSIRALYGDTAHPLIIQSTALFFNHQDRGKVYGHQINNGALDEGTVALDSWLSIGAASNNKFGIPKSEDPDGSIVGGVNNDGGSAEVPGGLLVNEDPDAGIPLTVQDGLVPSSGGSVLPPSFNAFGDDPGLVFADSTTSFGLVSGNIRIGCSTPGVLGPTAENKILVAQLTTTGELTFQLNLEIELPDGTVAKYVATDTLLFDGETPNGLLNYPPECGCTDPNFLEYDPAAGCDDGSCATAIVLGCLDTLACNFDPGANFAVAQLCCYGPDDCNGLDVQLVCPDVGSIEQAPSNAVRVYPNPTSGPVVIDMGPTLRENAELALIDVLGRTIEPSVVVAGSNNRRQCNLHDLPDGQYFLLIRSTTGQTAFPIMKLGEQ